MRLDLSVPLVLIRTIDPVVPAPGVHDQRHRRRERFHNRSAGA
jgi:hypothetical protein